MNSSRIRILSGVQPTGKIHLGNYLGALRHWVAAQERAECLYLVADLHAITVAQDPDALRDNTLQRAGLLLATGIDPLRSTLFVQSHISEHAELTWVLNCSAGFGELQRMTQFKDQVSGRRKESVGLFTYPVLQAADILLYGADRVPVGEDQEQHLELTRDLALRFNARFGPTLKAPVAAVAAAGARIMDLQDPRKKMSKSSTRGEGTIYLTDSADLIKKKIRSAVTDSGREVKFSAGKPAISNLLTIYTLTAGVSNADAEAQFANQGYGDFKRILAEAVVERLRPIQERYLRIIAEPHIIVNILHTGATRARSIAAQTLALVYERIGFLPR